MKRLITLLSILTIGMSAVSFGATPTAMENEATIEVTRVEKATAKTPEEAQWERAHAYAHYRSETR